ncbi:fused MFS/spermidine synthase [Peristeroidobacter agariperforans]|uniref:fused MFS/spermidine synthase n=1 Tax=Peristeroidobacter agariperforans TaxID=268404 RepID=UPI001E2CC032|nr:fused MFS/spermidine synthase [Peristeroidobacter agariperforans]
MAERVVSAAEPTALERGRPRQIVLACLLMVASGFAGLAYQVVWTQQSTSWLGHESAAVLAVVAAFFGGLALGALTLGSRIDRSARPARWYAGCEIVIGAWSLTLAALLEPASSALLGLIGPQPSATWHWFVAFFGTALLLLPATVSMGATLPAMERVFATTSARNISISALYAANTAGAVVGVIAAAFWLVPQLGLAHSSLACAVLNFVCAAVALSLQTNGDSATPAPGSGILRGPNHTLLLLAATGLLGIGYEVLVVRALSQVAENTVYTFALLLAVYLIGTALGAAAYSRWRASKPMRSGEISSDRLLTPLIQVLAATCLLGTLLLAGADEIKNSFIGAFGPSVASALAGEVAMAIIAFLLPTLVMGALFSHLSTEARDGGISFGHAIGVNTVGAAIAPLLFGLVLLPVLGLKPALLLISVGYLLLVARPAWSKPAQWLVIGVTAASVIWSPSLHNTHIPRGGRLVSYSEGVMASVTVIEDKSGVATLHINNRQQEGSSATLLADARQALLPVLLHPNSKRALFLGLGTGLTASSATLQPSLQVDVVELVPEVIDAAQHFESSYPEAADRSRLHTMSADARRFVRTSEQQYDVIVADNFHPARSGSASLYTVEHFEAVRQRLAEGGVFCQWLPLHQLDVDTLRSIVRSFLAVYPNASAVLATLSLDTPTIGLIARRDGERFSLEQVSAQLSAANSYDVEGFGFPDDLALLGSFFAGPHSLTTFAGAAPLNTDDRPIVAYRAPTITYSPVSTPRERLLELLGDVEINPEEILAGELNLEWSNRLEAYWTARDRFIEAGRDVRPTSDVRDMLAQVREPLLEVLHISPGFRPAYDPLVRMAAALAGKDSAAARSLLSELQQVQPDRPEAAQLLNAIDSQAQ